MHTRSYLAASALLLAALACRNDTTGPTAPAVTTPRATASAPPSVISPGTWIIKADYPINIWGATSASVTNAATLRSTLYVIGGRTKESPPGYGSMTAAVRAYNVTANTWQSRAAFPRPIQNTNGAVVVNGKVYVSGGFSRRWDPAAGVYRLEDLATLYVYDPALNQWSRKRDMPISTVNGVSSVYQGNLYVATPCYSSPTCDSQDLTHGALFRYNPTTDRWVLLSRTPHDPWLAAGGFIGTKFYISNQFAVYGMDVYDVTTGKWTTGAPRPIRSCSGAYTTYKAKLYQTECFQDYPVYDTSSVHPMLVYDPALNTWTQRAAPPPRTDKGTLSRVTLTNGEVRLEFVGGSRPGNNLQYIP